jgi:hypothetical protein
VLELALQALLPMYCRSANLPHGPHEYRES